MHHVHVMQRNASLTFNNLRVHGCVQVRPTRRAHDSRDVPHSPARAGALHQAPPARLRRTVPVQGCFLRKAEILTLNVSVETLLKILCSKMVLRILVVKFNYFRQALEPPPIDAVIEAEVLLREMRALDNNDELTPLGKILARLPVEPR